MSKTVRNASEMELTVPGIGIVKPNESVEVGDDFHNANFEELPVISRKEAKKLGLDVDKIEKEAVEIKAKK